MQLINFALLGFAVAVPTAQQYPGAEKCHGLNGARVLSRNKEAYKLDCANWVDAEQDKIVKIVDTQTGYWGCLTACDEAHECEISEYIASDRAQTQGSCTLFKKGVTVRQGQSNSWTLATKINNDYPQPNPDDGGIPKGQDTFGLVAVSAGSPIHNTGIKASHGSLTVGGKQDATCDQPSDFATIWIDNGDAYLFAHSATPQQLWVDRSGMGQGATGYTTGAQPAPRNAERNGFSVDQNGNLRFKGAGAKACPPNAANKDAGWSLWFTDARQPGSNEGCISISLRASKSNNPISCSYTSS